jgi:ectoine hydroxylase-related dioxygenase (phytanoyl-CoA dioxygenase family)
MLLGNMLNDVHDDWAGNLAVWPGTHRLYEDYFRQHGPEALLNGMPPIQMPEPMMVKGNAGDIVMAHYQLAHTAAPNVSPNVRYAIYFRLRRIHHDAQWKQAMTDIWLEWPGIRIN